jgi:hypothetical protein
MHRVGMNLLCPKSSLNTSTPPVLHWPQTNINFGSKIYFDGHYPPEQPLLDPLMLNYRYFLKMLAKLGLSFLHHIARPSRCIRSFRTLLLTV